MTLKAFEKTGINDAIAAGNVPRAPSGARGLIISIPGARHRTLVDVKGNISKFGAYYYAQTQTPAPNRGFDYGQILVRVGRRLEDTLMDRPTVCWGNWHFGGRLTTWIHTELNHSNSGTATKTQQ